MPFKFCKPKGSAPTQCLFIANCGLSSGVQLETIEEVLGSYGGVQVVAPENPTANHVFAIFQNVATATAALQALSQAPCEQLGNRVLKVQYAGFQEEKVPSSKPVFLDATTANIPGLQLHPDFISVDEEQQLLDYIDGQPWMFLAKRRVQHYGYKFEYVTRNVNSCNFLGPLPHVFQQLALRLQQLPDVPVLDQLTVNEYPPGVGLAPHIDTHSAFTGSILSVSLAGPAVMEMRRGDDHRPIFLPPRSVLVMGGESRYCWLHYIPHRKSDDVNGTVVQRAARRVSLTFRKARGFDCDCPYPECCDSQGVELPPTRLAMMQAQAPA